MKKIKLLLVDDHAIVRMGLASLLGTRPDFEIVGEASGGADGIRLALQQQPDVILMDLMMPDMDGAAATEKLMAANPSAHVLILTSYASADGVAYALRAGACGAIMKSAEFSDLICAIRTIADGRRYISPEIEQMISDDPPVPKLSARQEEILHSVTRGFTNEDIANQLGISLPMVKEHINALLAKMGASNRAEAVAIALRKHLLKI